MRTPQIAPSKNGASVTPNDSEALPKAGLKGWSVNADGDVKLLLVGHVDGEGALDDAQAITVYAVRGVRYPDQVAKIFATGTTATGINVYW